MLYRGPHKEFVLRHPTRDVHQHADSLSSVHPRTDHTRRRLDAAHLERLHSGASAPLSSLRRLGARLLPAGALALSAAIVVSVTVPANAITQSAAPAAEVAGVAAPTLIPQSLDVADVDGVNAGRDDYTITAPPPKPKPKPKPEPVSAPNYAPASVASSVGAGAVRWPFPTQVPISDGFGPRVSPCAGCSSLHMGTDFLGGEGNPIYAIADGVVSVSAASGGYGTHVYIDHVVNGEQVRSLYSHMQAASSPLYVGQRVSAGDFVGTVGRTGNVTGPHLHFELVVNGVNVDPYAWLQANAG